MNPISRINQHRRRIAALIAALAAAVLAVILAACSSSASGTNAVSGGNQVAQSEYAMFNAAVPYPFSASNPPSDPLERKNIAARLTQYNTKGDTNYVYLFAWGSPTPIGYYVIRGKVSSTGSQMTSDQITTNCDGSNHDACSVINAIGDDGSYGPNEGGSSGVFFFTSNGTLIEPDQPFVVSSTPIKLYADVPQLDAPTK